MSGVQENSFMKTIILMMKTIITIKHLDKYYKMLKSSPALWERIMAVKYQTWDSHGFSPLDRKPKF
jgi:hypothetical protein